MSIYSERARAIHGLTLDLRRRMEVVTAMSVADKMQMIDTGVEVVNKLLYCFRLDQEMFERVDQDLNARYRDLKPEPDSIDRLFFFLLGIVRRVENQAEQWVERYAN